MKEILRVAVCQMNVVWENPEANLRIAGRFVDEAVRGEGADLIVLPEFFTTGFSSNPAFAEEEGGRTMLWLRERASETGAALAGSIPVREDGNVYNRMYMVCPEGRTVHYDKRHLFRMSGENEVFAPGMSPRITDLHGWNIAMNVCYDLRFPVWSRNVGNSYDLLLNVASWPASRIGAAAILARARAVENLSYFIFCNRTGESPSDHYRGGSMILDYKGNPVESRTMECGSDGELVTACLDLPALRRFREKFPAWADADGFEIKY